MFGAGMILQYLTVVKVIALYSADPRSIPNTPTSLSPSEMFPGCIARSNLWYCHVWSTNKQKIKLMFLC